MFIGFSFRDDDVMHVVLKALAERRERLKVLIVDKTYTEHNVRARLDEAARRSTFPVYVPPVEHISALRLNFGSDVDFDSQILTQCRTLLGKETKS